MLETQSLPWCAPQGRNRHFSCSRCGVLLKSVLHGQSQPRLFVCGLNVLSRGHFTTWTSQVQPHVRDSSHLMQFAALEFLASPLRDRSAQCFDDSGIWFLAVPPPCSSFGMLWGFASTLPSGVWHVLGCYSRKDLSGRKNWMKWKQEFGGNTFKTWTHSEVLWKFPLLARGLCFFNPSGHPTTFILPSHLIIQWLATLLPMAFLEMSWLFSLPWGLALCRMLIFSKLCWLITVFLSILFLKCPLHSPEQPGHQAGEWKLEGTTV